jgi:putative Holliday junction resolvase
MGRIAAIDFGLKRIGIAISDEGKVIAFPASTVPGGPNAALEVKKAFGDKSIELIVIGLPRLLNGKEGPMADLVRKFTKELEDLLHIPTHFVDERFSSKVADTSLREMNLNRKERSKIIDVTTATMILQLYLEHM